MKFKSDVTVLGMKASKGVLDNGQAYDSTKVYCVVDMDASKGNALGKAAGEYPLGLSGELERYRTLQFPFEGVAEFEMVTNGKTTKSVMLNLVQHVKGK